MRRLLIVLLLSLIPLTGGCAFRNAIEHGHSLVAQRRYREALAEYQRALAMDPSHEDARRFVAQITPYAIQEAETDARGAIAAGRYEEAMRHAAYVERLDGTRAAALRQEVSAALEAAVGAAMRKGEMTAAYGLTARARRLVPKAPWIAPALQSLRHHFFQESERLTEGGEFLGALRALDVVERHDPAVRDEVNSRRQQVRGRWSESVAAEARAAEEKGQRGSAAGLFARAFEIAGRAEHADELRRLAAELRREGSFVLALSRDGDALRARRIEDRFEAGALAIEGVVKPRDSQSGITLLASLHAPAASCRDSETTSTASHEYVAGTRQVPNPAHAALTSRIAAETAALSEQSARAAELREQARQARSEADRCGSGPAEVALEQARARLARLEAELEQQRALVRELEADTSEGAQRRLERARRRLAELESRVAGARAEVAERQRVLAEAEARCASHRRRAEEAEAALAAAQAALGSATRELRRLEQERAATPALIAEDIIDVFHYPVRHVTRRCQGTLVLSLEPAWTSPETHRFDTDATTRDDTHAAHPRYGVTADPLRFPEPDSALLDRLDDRAAERAVATLRDKVRAFYRRMSDTALELAGREPEAASDMMVAMLLAAPRELEPSAVERFAAHLHARYGLEHWETLRH